MKKLQAVFVALAMTVGMANLAFASSNEKKEEPKKEKKEDHKDEHKDHQDDHHKPEPKKH